MAKIPGLLSQGIPHVLKGPWDAGRPHTSGANYWTTMWRGQRNKIIQKRGGPFSSKEAKAYREKNMLVKSCRDQNGKIRSTRKGGLYIAVYCLYRKTPTHLLWRACIETNYKYTVQWGRAWDKIIDTTRPRIIIKSVSIWTLPMTAQSMKSVLADNYLLYL